MTTNVQATARLEGGTVTCKLPSGARAELRLQMYFNLFLDLKTRFLATALQDFWNVLTNNSPPENSPVCYFYYLQLFSESILLPPSLKWTPKHLCTSHQGHLSLPSARAR